MNQNIVIGSIRMFKRLLKNALVLVLILAISAPAFNVNASSGCSSNLGLTLVNQNVNSIVVQVNFTGEGTADLSWTLSGGTIPVGNGWQGQLNMPYEGGANQQVTVSKDGNSCTLNIYISQWDTDPGSGPGPVVQNVVNPVSPSAACWNLVSINVSSGESVNSVNVWLTVMGELSTSPFTVNFGDGSYTNPVRDGDHTVSVPHDYDLETLKKGVEITVSISGGNETCLALRIDSNANAYLSR